MKSTNSTSSVLEIDEEYVDHEEDIEQRTKSEAAPQKGLDQPTGGRTLIERQNAQEKEPALQGDKDPDSLDNHPLEVPRKHQADLKDNQEDPNEHQDDPNEHEEDPEEQEEDPINEHQDQKDPEEDLNKPQEEPEEDPNRSNKPQEDPEEHEENLNKPQEDPEKDPDERQENPEDLLKEHQNKRLIYMLSKEPRKIRWGGGRPHRKDGHDAVEKITAKPANVFQQSSVHAGRPIMNRYMGRFRAPIERAPFVNAFIAPYPVRPVFRSPPIPVFMWPLPRVAAVSGTQRKQIGSYALDIDGFHGVFSPTPGRTLRLQTGNSDITVSKRAMVTRGKLAVNRINVSKKTPK